MWISQVSDTAVAVAEDTSIIRVRQRVVEMHGNWNDYRSAVIRSSSLMWRRTASHNCVHEAEVRSAAARYYVITTLLRLQLRRYRLKTVKPKLSGRDKVWGRPNTFHGIYMLNWSFFLLNCWVIFASFMCKWQMSVFTIVFIPKLFKPWKKNFRKKTKKVSIIRFSSKT